MFYYHQMCSRVLSENFNFTTKNLFTSNIKQIKITKLLHYNKVVLIRKTVDHNHVIISTKPLLI